MSFANMLGLLVLAFLGLASARTGDRLQLLNYGVVMEETATVDLNRQNWVHTFRVKMPLDLPLSRDDTDCVLTNKDLCQSHETVNHHLSDLKQQLLKDWDRLVAAYLDLPLANFSRQDPSIPGAQVFNSIYDNIQDQNGRKDYNFVRNANRSSSHQLPKTPIVDHIDALTDQLDRFKMLVGEISNKLDMGLDMATELTHVTDLSWRVHDGVERAIQTLSSAKNRVLTRDLVGEVHMNQMNVNLERLMSDLFPTYRLSKVGTETDFYYHADQPVYAHRRDGFLYVSVLVPLSHGALFTAYRALPFPLVYGSSFYGTLLTGIPAYFLTDLRHKGPRDPTLYTTMDADQFAKCTQFENGVVTCPESLTTRVGVLQPSCLMGLVSENKTMIRQECQYGLLAKPLQPSLWEYSPGRVLLTHTEEAHVDCRGVVYRVPAAPLQVVELPCQCSLKANNMQVPDRFYGCFRIPEPRSLFPFNLGALLQVHSPEALKQYNGSGLFTQAPTLDLPELLLTPPSRQDLHDLSSDLTLNLTTVMLRWRAGEEIFTSPTDALLKAEQGRISAGPRTLMITVASFGSLLLALCGLAMLVLAKNHRSLSTRLHNVEHAAHLTNVMVPPDNDDPEADSVSVPIQMSHLQSVENGYAQERLLAQNNHQQ